MFHQNDGLNTFPNPGLK